MLTAFCRAFRTPDLRKKLLFTLVIIALFRLGASLPTPGIVEKNVRFNPARLKSRPDRHTGASSTCSAAARY